MCNPPARRKCSGADVLVSLFSERESHAVFFLQSQNMTRFDAVNYLSHGITKNRGDEGADADMPPSGADEDAAEGRTNKRGPMRSPPIASISTRKRRRARSIR